MVSYHLKVFDKNGVLRSVLTDFQYLAYSRRVNRPGMLDFAINGDHKLLEDLEDKWQFEVWRNAEGSTWKKEFTGLFRWIQWKHDGKPLVRIICSGILSMLSWRIVAWTAGQTDRTRFINKPAETIAKMLIQYNATSDAIQANGRIRDGEIPGLSIETNQGSGNSVDWFCSYANLLETLKDLAAIGGGDFDLVKTGPVNYEYRWYDGQLGEDKTNTILFSLARGNMANPVYLENRQPEKTVAVVGGPGEEDEREVVVATGGNYSADNDIEVFVNAADVGTQSGLEARGNQKLEEEKVIREFDFNTVQIPSCRYGVDYDLGDLVRARNPYTGEVVTAKVAAVSVGIKRGGDETVNVEVANV